VKRLIKIAVIVAVFGGLVFAAKKLMGGLGPEPGSTTAPKPAPSLIPEPAADASEPPAAATEPEPAGDPVTTPSSNGDAPAARNAEA
jgi:hypothetical protein